MSQVLMLSELEELQESDERLWTCTSISFTMKSRIDEGDELVEREYTFAHAKEWDKWLLQEFEEKRTEDTDSVTDRCWRGSRHIMWQDDEVRDIDVPPEIGQALKEAINANSVTIQIPRGSFDGNECHTVVEYE